MKPQLFAIMALLLTTSNINAASISIADPSGPVSYHESTPDSNTIIYGIGVYETSIGRGFREHPIGTANIHIESQGSNQSVLVLSSYEPTNWNITGTGISSISSIYLFGYHDQSVTISNSSIDIFEFSYLGEGDYQGITYEWNTPEINTFENIIGDNIDVFAGTYHATNFTIQAVPVPPALLLFISGIVALFGITKKHCI